MKISFVNINSILEVNTSCLVYFITEDYLKSYIKKNGNGETLANALPLQQAIMEYNFKASFCENCFSSTNNLSNKTLNFNKILFIGLGKETEITKTKMENIGYETYKLLNNNKIKTATFLFNAIIDSNKIKFKDELINKTTNYFYKNLIFGFDVGQYKFNKYFTGNKSKTNEIKEAFFIMKDAEEMTKSYKELEIVKDNVFYCRNLINEPANVVNPDAMVVFAKELTKLKVKVEVLSVKDMLKLKMGSLLSVGQGSDNESKMIILKYDGANDNSKPLAFVGKGVTFDSGGLSLKPSNAMDTMKCDMSGSAVVLSLVRLLAMRKAKVNVVGVMPLVENMPSGRATKPGDIVTSMSGQTIEVLNTDAEGRMILADALYYAATKFDPKILIDLATLTGAICISLGEKYAGLFTNNNDLCKELEYAGKESGEEVWRMPLSELGGFYDKQIDSEFADMRNTGKTRDGGSITAAQFLQRFIDKHHKWAHIDIAATAYVNQEGFLTNKHATGYGVRLLNELIKKYYEN